MPLQNINFGRPKNTVAKHAQRKQPCLH